MQKHQISKQVVYNDHEQHTKHTPKKKKKAAGQSATFHLRGAVDSADMRPGTMAPGHGSVDASAGSRQVYLDLLTLRCLRKHNL